VCTGGVCGGVSLPTGTATHEALNESFDAPLGEGWAGPTSTASTTATWSLWTNETGDSILRVEALSDNNSPQSNYSPVDWGNEISWSYDLGVLEYGDFSADVHFDWSQRTLPGSNLADPYLYLVMELLDDNDAVFAKVGVFDGSSVHSPTYVGAYEEAGSYYESRGSPGLYDFVPDLAKFSISREGGNLQISRYVENSPTAILSSSGNTTGIASVRLTIANFRSQNYWTTENYNVWAAVETVRVMTTEQVVPVSALSRRTQLVLLGVLLTLGLARLVIRRRLH